MQKRFLSIGLALLLAGQALAQERRFTIYLIHHGWHAGIAFCQADLEGTDWPEEVRFPARRYVEVGWGEAGYYPDPDPGAGDALRAALWPTAAVLHVVAFDHPPARIFSGPVRQVELDSMAFRKLVAFVAGYFKRDAQGKLQPVAPALYGQEGQFYAARGRYHLLNNSNRWVARALRTAGLPVWPARVLTIKDLWAQIEPLSSMAEKAAACPLPMP
ncbi:conserved hypothetical protein [Rhodothermus profundi]|uniref:DUF2459 domain-containing protein n=2 Tax=Rhodothermus profundi TaxID=633813 RepID=A0A1M6VVR4_9BACT|nr:conserved hypothetical protein [Rhodothermus profundi]